MKNFKFSFKSSGANGSSYEIYISVSKTKDGYLFRCDDTETDCAHPLTQPETAAFLEALGAEPKSGVFAAVKQMVELGKAAHVHRVIHQTLKPSFVWTSTDWS